MESKIIASSYISATLLLCKIVRYSDSVDNTISTSFKGAAGSSILNGVVLWLFKHKISIFQSYIT